MTIQKTSFLLRTLPRLFKLSKTSLSAVLFVMLQQVNSIKYFPYYAQAQRQNPSNLVDAVRTILQTRNYPKDTEFKARLVESKLYGGGHRNSKTKLILETLEETYGHKEQVAFENDIF